MASEGGSEQPSLQEGTTPAQQVVLQNSETPMEPAAKRQKMESPDSGTAAEAPEQQAPTSGAAAFCTLRCFQSASLNADNCLADVGKPLRAARNVLLA